MIRSLLFFCFLFFCVRFGIAQSYAKLDTIIYPQNISFTGESLSRFLVSQVVKDRLFVGYIKKNKFFIEERDVNKPEQSGNIYGIKLKEKIKTSDIIDLTINIERKEACIITFESVIILSLSKKKVVSSFPNRRFRYVFLDNDFVYLGRYYNHHPKDSKNKCALYKYSKTGQTKDSLLLHIPFPEYTYYQPSRLFAFNGQTFVVSLFDGYRLLLIDKDLKTIDTFSVEKSDWVSPSLELSESVKKNFDNLNMYFPHLDNENYNRISRIEFVEFADSNNLVVRWFKYDSLKKYPVRYVDEFYFSNGKMKQKAETTMDTPIPVKNTLPIKEGHFPLRSNNHVCHYHAKGLIHIKVGVYIEITATTTYKEFYETRQEKAKTQDPVISIWFFRYE